MSFSPDDDFFATLKDEVLFHIIAHIMEPTVAIFVAHGSGNFINFYNGWAFTISFIFFSFVYVTKTGKKINSNFSPLNSFHFRLIRSDKKPFIKIIKIIAESLSPDLMALTLHLTFEETRCLVR